MVEVECVEVSFEEIEASPNPTTGVGLGYNLCMGGFMYASPNPTTQRSELPGDPVSQS